MTDQNAGKPKKPAGGEKKRVGVLETRARRAALAIAAERLWRAGVALASLALAFAALSFAGLWLHVGVFGRMAGVAVFAAAGLFVFFRGLLRAAPSRREALARLDEAAPPALKPAASLDDGLAAADPHPETSALWAAHRRRLEAALAVAPAPAPAPHTERRDPLALRALALTAAVATAFVAGDDKATRLLSAFDWRAPEDVAARVDAWLDPPPYTGRPPIVLPAKNEAGEAVAAPVNSVLRARFSHGGVETAGALAPLPAAQGKAQSPGEREEAFKLTGAARVALPDRRSFDLSVIPDNPPVIALKEPPRNNTRGSMTLAFHVEDDYGVAGAEAVFSRANGPRALYEPPRLPLTLPAGREAVGDARATLDIGDSPYAGARMTMTLAARDEGGNEGASTPVEVTLPQRRFANPLARALVEQRRNLALDPQGERARVLSALQGLSLAPQLFDAPSDVYLGLRAARRGLEGRRSDDDLRGVVDLLWAMALGLENGDQGQAERDLRAAQDKLRDAMARGADPEEIAELTREMREAMNKFLEGLREKQAKPGDRQQAEAGEDSAQTLSQDDLDKLLDDLDKALKSGDSARAQELLDQLQDIMENLQAAQGGGEGSGGPGGKRKRQMSKALSELDALAREQQRLRDETFRDRRPGKGEAGGEGEAGSAADRQQGLRDRLEREQKALRGAGEDPGGELDAADKAMKEAEEALGQPDARGRAVDAQGRALEALRRGADQLAEKMREEGQDGGQQGEEGGRSAARGQGEGGDKDPLGRPARDSRARLKYDPLGLPPAQRAHKVQEELRRRRGQADRPAEELDYLERLLKR